MTIETVTATANYTEKDSDEKVTKEISAEFDFGTDMDDLIGIFGAEAVYHHARANMRVSVQGALRTFAQQGLATGSDELKAALVNWQMPSGRVRGKSKVEKARDLIASLPEAERASFLEELGLAD